MSGVNNIKHFRLISFFQLFFVTTDEFCEEYPHALIPTPGYWIECSRQKIAQINQHTIWDDSESDHDEPRPSCSGDGQHDRNYSDLYEDDEDSDFVPRRKTTIEEQWEQQQSFELTSVEQETYEKYFYGSEHWNYFTNDEGTLRLSPDTTAAVVNLGVIDFYSIYFSFSNLSLYTDKDLGPVILSIKQETLNGRDQFRILVRAISYTVHGLIPASCVFADR